MIRRTQMVSLLGLGSALMLSTAVFAQPPGAPGAAPPPAAGGTAETGAVNNESTTTTTTTTTSAETTIPNDLTGDTLPNTGGAPWLMALAGSAVAGSALILRRKF